MMEKEYWINDGDRIRITDNWDDIVLVKNPEIEKYLKSSNKFFIVAAKGLGKTLILKAKSKMYRDQRITSIFHPKNELCEKIGRTLSDAAFSVEDLARFKSLNIWITIWEVCIATLLLRMADKGIPTKLHHLFGDNDHLTEYLRILLRERKFLHRYAAALSNELMHQVRRLDESVSVFVDNVDEAMQDNIGYILKKGEGSGEHSEDIWVKSQLGLMEAIKEIHFANKHIKVFATIRIEALRQDPGSTRLQTRDYCTELSYDKMGVKRIFERNIEMLDNSSLTNSSSPTPTGKFLGFEARKHPFVKNNGEAVSEDAFDYIYRHTFGTPREIVEMGKQIHLIDPKERTPETIHSRVHKVAGELFDQKKREVIPYFDNMAYHAFCQQVNTNILKTSEIKEITTRLPSPYQSIVPFLYKNGLLGYAARTVKNRFVQLFLPSAEHAFDEVVDLPASEYFFLHPVLEEDLQASSYFFRNCRSHIVGSGYPFVEKVQPEKAGYHVHIGAGRLGLGLIVPTISEISRLIVIQRYSDKWRKLKVDHANLLRDGRVVVRFKVITDDLDGVAPEACLNEKENLFVLSNRTDFLRRILHNADSVSTAVGKRLNEIGDLFLSTDRRRKLNVYPFENDQAEVLSFKNRVSACPDICVIPTVADRMCTSVSITSGSVESHCEEFGEIVVLGENADVDELFGRIRNQGKRNIVICKTSQEFDFFYRRKFWIINGIHMICAIHAYSYLIKNGETVKDAQRYKMNILFDLEGFAETIRFFLKVQALRLLIETDYTVLNQIFPGQDMSSIYRTLLEYGDLFISRIKSFPDSLGRILNLKDYKSFKIKYEQRIRELFHFVSTMEKEVTRFIESNDLIDVTITEILKKNLVFHEDLTSLLLAKMR